MIIRLLIAVLAIYLLYRIARGLFLKGSAAKKELPKARPGEDMVEDPYCHVYVPISDAYAATVEGHTRYFCSGNVMKSILMSKGRGNSVPVEGGKK